MGEGGALLIRDQDAVEKAEIIREKGTDRSKFLRGQVDKYTWVEVGSSYLPSEMNAAYLAAQLEMADEINEDRLNSWYSYYEQLSGLAAEGRIELPVIPAECEHNAHMFYIKAADIEERDALISYLKQNDIMAVFHYVPLHSSPAGRRLGRFHGEDRYTTNTFERLLRLPMYYGLESDQVEYICGKITEFYKR
jgi:dTDP-4-amino-4,6-dideoxygalactose transaminase